MQVGLTHYVLHLRCMYHLHIGLTCFAASVQVFQLLFTNLALVRPCRRINKTHLHKASNVAPQWLTPYAGKSGVYFNWIYGRQNGAMNFAV